MSIYVYGVNLVDEENVAVFSGVDEFKFEALNGKNTYELNFDDINKWLTLVEDIDPETGKCRIDLETGDELYVYVDYNKPVTGEVIFTLDLNADTGQAKYSIVKNTCNLNLVSFEMNATRTNMKHRTK